MRLVALAALVTLAGCTAARRDGDVVVIQCGAVAPLSVCENRAFELCPNGYDTLQSDRGINRTELRVRCKL